MIMKNRTVTLLTTAALLSSTAAGLRAELPANPYDVIVNRNAFALKPATVETTTPVAPPPPNVEVLLTGICTLKGVKKVLLQVTDKSPGKKTEFLSPLVETDVQGRVEVVSIDADKGSVVVRVDGNERTLTFDKDAPKPGAALPPAPGPNPALLASMGHPMPNPAALTATPNAAPPTTPATSPERQSVMVGGANGPSAAGPTPSATRPSMVGGVGLGRPTSWGAAASPTAPPRPVALR
jgi:hypothetical protein